MANESDSASASQTPYRALIIGDDEIMTSVPQQTLEDSNWQAEVYRRLEDCPSPEKDWLLIVVCVDDDLVEAVKTLETLRDAILEERSFVIVIAKRPSANDVVKCTELGATKYLAWPVIPTQLLKVSERARKKARYELSRDKFLAFEIKCTEDDQGNYRDRRIVGSSHAMLKLSRRIVRIARTQGMRVFITGETGTGKEVVARLIHELGGCPGPFRAINCAATVEALLESELFGHEKGAFTGAHTTKRGYWEDAANGTLFLDEITETSLSVQAKLLRALQEGVIRRGGSNQEIKVSPRVIAASNKDVETAIKEGAFRQDLYYRLGQMLRLPPLRDRREDIPHLVEHFWRRSSTSKVVTPEAIDALCEYDWPGNVRQLESVVQQLIAFAGRFVFREDILRCLQKEENPEEVADKFLHALWQVSKQYEKSKWPTVAEIRNLYVQKAYSLLGKESAVAKRLGIDVRTVGAILEAERKKLVGFPESEHHQS